MSFVSNSFHDKCHRECYEHRPYDAPHAGVRILANGLDQGSVGCRFERRVHSAGIVVSLLAGVFSQPLNYAVLRVPGGSPSTRNVWSAAVLQAKSEDDRIGLRECIRP